MNISIIGAGPAGNYLAYLLAKAGYSVNVFEEHDCIGKPVQCTGIVTSTIKKIIDIPEDVIVNKIKTARIYAPDKNFVKTDFKEENLILDREKFDDFLAKKAIGNGARYFLGYKFLDHKDGHILLRYQNKNLVKIPTDILVGADGPLSSVGKVSGMIKKRKFFTGIQVRARYTNENIVDFFTGFGKFAWIVPENKKIARIGLIASKSQKKEFDEFLRYLKIKKKDILEYQGGIIPKYEHYQKTSKNNVFLLGDAAGFVKATTAGGIIQSLEAAEELFKSIKENKNYQKLWRKRIGKNLLIHLIIRRVLDNFSKKDYNYLVKIFNSKKNKKILETTDRDNIKKIFIKLLFSEPRLLYFVKNIIKF